MAVALDAAGTRGSNNGVTSLAYTGITVGAGANRAMVVAACFQSDPGAFSVARWDDGASNQNLTLIASGITANGQITKLWGLVAPISGNKTLQLTWTNVTEIGMAAVSWTGVDQTGGTTSFPNSASATGNSTLASVTISLPANGAGVGVEASGTSAGVSGTSATNLFTFSGATAVEGGASYSTSSGTFTTTITATDQWVQTATGIAPVATNIVDVMPIGAIALAGLAPTLVRGDQARVIITPT